MLVERLLVNCVTMIKKMGIVKLVLEMRVVLQVV